MEADELKQVMVRVVKGQPQARLGPVDVDAVQVHDVVVVQLPQQHDLPDGRRADALALLSDMEPNGSKNHHMGPHDLPDTVAVGLMPSPSCLSGWARQH